MATHRAILGVLQALKDRLDLRLPALTGGNPKALILGSQALATAPAGENLGIYLHRIAVDPFARNRYLAPAENRRQRRPELPVNLHVLLIGWSTKNDSEVGYLAAAMQIIGSALTLDVSHLGSADSGWDEHEAVQVLPEEMSTEDLMRLWDSLPGDYRLSSPYLIKTLRLAPDEEPAEAPLVRTLVYPAGTTHAARVEGEA